MLTGSVDSLPKAISDMHKPAKKSRVEEEGKAK